MADALASLLLCAQVAGAALWWWISPGGFPLGHPRFWSNRALPVAVLVVALVGLVGRSWSNYSLFRAALVALVMLWTAAVVSGCAVFPVSAVRFAAPGFAGVVALWGASVLELVKTERRERSSMCAAAFLAALAGVCLPWTQRAGDPETHPSGAAGAPLATEAGETTLPILQPLGGGASMVPADGSLQFDGPVALHVRPLLTFESVSPDRCWTILAPRSAAPAPPLLVSGKATAEGVTCIYRGLAKESLQVERDEKTERYLVEATADLEHAVFSHLNIYSEVAIRGTAPLFLSFSACGDVRIEVRASDYPVGRPRRFACLDAGERFRVLEARSGEKGPFRTLAEGTLQRGEPLAITVWNGNEAAYRLTWSDWSTQASTALSPTAGWGIPENAIEFSLVDDGAARSANIWMTLAGTSIGRGWDSVGHAPGVYRNRLSIELLTD
ncbi:MAG TPA: hypothetical protein VHB77_18285 [Planctomycetaceae bacterium]|nr:hypothetical protein [Planctomycetaceae bacterium]